MSTTEYGIFSGEGLLEAGFWDRGSALHAMGTRYQGEDSHVAEVCPDHPEQERYYCEECEELEERVNLRSLGLG